MGDVREINLDQKPEPELFLPLNQAASVRRIIRSVDPNQPVSSLRSMDDVIDGNSRAAIPS